MPLKTDSSNYFKVRGSEFTNTTALCLSIWFYIPTGVSTAEYLGGTDDALLIAYSSSALRLTVDNTAGSTITRFEFGDPSKDAWHHLVVSYTTGATPVAYLDGTAVTVTETTNTAGTIKFNQAELLIGNGNGGIFQSLVLYNDTLDLSDATVRARFRQAPSRNQENQVPTGAKYLPNGENGRAPLIAIGTNGLHNFGEGPNGILVGTPQSTTVADPTSDQWSAQGFKGEEWQDCELCGWIFPASELTIQPETGLRVCTTGPNDFDEPAKTGSNKGRGIFLG